MKQKLAIGIVILSAAAGCRASSVGDPEIEEILTELAAEYPLAEIEVPLYRGSLGGLNMWAYCLSEGYPAVGYRKGLVQGPGAARDNWVCQRGAEQLAPVDHDLIDMDAACQWQFDRPDVTARPTDEDHAWSWGCYGG